MIIVVTRLHDLQLYATCDEKHALGERLVDTHET